MSDYDVLIGLGEEDFAAVVRVVAREHVPERTRSEAAAAIVLQMEQDAALRRAVVEVLRGVAAPPSQVSALTLGLHASQSGAAPPPVAALGALLDAIGAELRQQWGDEELVEGDGGLTLLWEDTGGFIRVFGPDRAAEFFLCDPWWRAEPLAGGSLLAVQAWARRVTRADAVAVSEVRFVEIVANSDWKLEWSNGRIYVMAGGSLDHSRIIANTAFELRRAKPAGCTVLSSETHLRSVTGAEWFADGVLVCGRAKEDPQRPHRLTNPTVLIEVVSPSSARRDHEEKLAAYRLFESLRAYLLVESTRVQVTVHSRREAGGAWTSAVVRRGGTIVLDVPPLTLAVDESLRRHRRDHHVRAVAAHRQSRSAGWTRRSSATRSKSLSKLHSASAPTSRQTAACSASRADKAGSRSSRARARSSTLRSSGIHVATMVRARS
jgi:Uma2 family endonuclease